MTTAELRELLLKLDPGGQMEVIRTRCSDYGYMEPDEVSVVQAIKRPSAQYLMRTHRSMSPDEQAAAREFVHFDGN